MNLKELMNKIVDFGLKNKLINTSVGCSSLYQINFEDIEDYPLLVFQPSSPHRVSQNFVEYTITLYWIDRLNSDNSNEFDIFSTSVENLKGIIKGMRNIKGIVDVSTDFDIVNFTDTQRLSDKCAGAYVTLKIDVLNENSCSLSNLEEEENEIKLKNQIKYIKIDRNGEYIITYDEGYNGLKEVEIDVELDTSIYVEEGYNQGKNVGIEEGKQLQKELLEPITITENGTYNRENGYSEIVVEVPDLNGDYDTGYNEGYIAGEENGVVNAGDIIAQTARVLDITENGTYVSQYSDPIYPDTITGVYPDGEDFYSLAKVNNVVYNTGIIPNETTKLEFWFEPDKQMDNLDGDWFSIVIDAEIDDYNCFRIRHYHMGTEFSYEFSIKGSRLVYDLIDGINHIEMSYADGLIVNGIKVDDFYQNISNDFNKPFYINGEPNLHNLPERTDDGKFGMIKITTNGVENIIIPAEDGFKNITTDEMLEVVYNGIYKYINNNPIIPEGNLIKTVNVNVQPKVNVVEIGLKFGYSTFKKLPEIFDFSYVTDMNNMFFNGRLETLEGIDFSNVTSLYNSFYYCPLKNLDYFNNYPNLINMEKAFSQTDIEIVPDLDLSNIDNAAEAFACENLIQVGNLNLEKAKNLSYFLKSGYDDRPLKKIGILNVPNVENMGDFFYYSFSPKEYANLTEMGGFVGLKCNWNGGGGLDYCPNLTYESCINILNGLADVTELGGRTLKVHPNFLTAVGDKINIGVDKGWTITT